jgi:hypothetical protein
MPARQRQRRSKSDTSRSRGRSSSAARSRAAAKAASKPPRRPAQRDPEAPHLESPTAVAAEALRTGIPPKRLPRHKDEIPREEDKLRAGDPDDSVLQNEYSGEDTPGGSTPTPDQNDVDEIGRAYGLQDEDSGTLRSGAEVLEKRDKRRPELRPPRRPQP